jgi:hypothetical protein
MVACRKKKRGKLGRKEMISWKNKIEHLVVGLRLKYHPSL